MEGSKTDTVNGPRQLGMVLLKLLASFGLVVLQAWAVVQYWALFVMPTLPVSGLSVAPVYGLLFIRTLLRPDQRRLLRGKPPTWEEMGRLAFVYGMLVLMGYGMAWVFH